MEISEALVKIGKATHLLRVKLFPQVKSAEDLAGDGLAVDLPEGGVLLDQIEAALAEGPDVHQSLDQGEKQCRGGIQVDAWADSAVTNPIGEEFPKA